MIKEFLWWTDRAIAFATVLFLTLAGLWGVIHLVQFLAGYQPW